MVGGGKIFKGKSQTEYEAEMMKFRHDHERWRDWCKNEKNEGVGFFPIFSEDFKPYLTQISGNALKLYLFLGAHINNKTGETMVSLDTMIKFFGAKKRTVLDWMKELVDHKLVARVQTGYKNRTRTFMLPYSQRYKDYRNNL